MSGLTYVASAIGLLGGVPNHLPMVPTVETQMASSFVNRVTPANVGGMALNVRFMQKAGVDPAVAVSGMGLNVVAGAIVHIVLLFVFFAWAGKGTGELQDPDEQQDARHHRGRAGGRRHRRGDAPWSKARAQARPRLPQAVSQGHRDARPVAEQARAAVRRFPRCDRSPTSARLRRRVAAYHGGASFAEVGAVYLGASLLAAAAPTPGGLGALEAALVAGFTGVGMESGVAVAVVLSYRLLTYWLPILPGWISFHILERRNLI